MNERSDQQLLRDYAEHRTEAAFTELVQRHIDVVHSAALRLTGAAHSAQDVTQAVFVALAQNAARLSHHPVLSGWLHTTTRNLAVKNIRTAVRRQHHESEAAAMNQLLATGPDRSWEEIAPHLDAALGELSESERDAVMLRYFQKKSAAEMARILGVSEDAAQKRVSRAVDRLRELFARRGVTVGASGLAVVISANAVTAAPAGLALIVSTGAIASAAISTAAVVAVTTAAKTIAMTTLQKTLVTITIATLAGVGLYEARHISEQREQIASLQNELAALRPDPAGVTATSDAPVEPAPRVATSGNQASDANEWTRQLLALNDSDWRQAFAIGQNLAALPPDIGLAILHANWNSITNGSARQQLLKAFQFAAHERLPAVLDLGLNDPAPEVQNWALTYLKDVALQDFSSDYTAARAWLATHRDSKLDAAVGAAIWQVAANLPALSGNQLLTQLELLKGANQFLRKHPETLASSGLSQALANVARGGDAKTAAQALRAASGLALGEAWLRENALPLLGANQPRQVTDAAAEALGQSGGEWAVQPLLDTLSESVYATNGRYGFGVSAALAALKSPKAIPTMIALIEAENTYNTVYGIGYYGLGKLTGVSYDEKHDGAWWRQWWESNKQRFPAEVQAMEIPKLSPVRVSAAQ